jgi:hypothetical protein
VLEEAADADRRAKLCRDFVFASTVELSIDAGALHLGRGILQGLM